MYETNFGERPVANEPPRQATIKDVIQDAKNMLAELIQIMADTNIQAFGQPPVEKGGSLEGKCLFDDVVIVTEQARMALAMMNDMRKRLI